ncbi:MAG: glycosyltransferase family 4 protein [Proteobacteria bacterium]|nr:glycosyltransferase family 4 protein [Pseudomonadota bacterium]
MIFFVGPLPPPLHGFSAINAKMLAKIKSEGPVKVFDLSPKLGGKLFLVRLLYLLCTFSFSLAFFRPSCVYMGLSGGIRQLLDVMFIAMARVFRVPMFVHHHSYAYINANFWYSKFVFRLLRSATHIVLCPDMGNGLAERYQLDKERVVPLSNAAFVDGSGSGSSEDVEQVPRESFSLGFLSNITREKGIFDFFDLIEALAGKGVNVQGVIAGPVDSTIESEFSARLGRLKNVRHLGAVYGDKKAEFFREIDLLVFPTRYVNEAEPVTIIEAQSFGVPVIAVKRGCIGCMVPELAGRVVDSVADFVAVGVEEVLVLLEKPELLERSKSESRRFYEESAASSLLTLDRLVTAMAGAH